jgi:hypothetical protein
MFFFKASPLAAIAGLLLALASANAQSNIIFEADFNGPGGDTGGATDMVTFGGTGTISADGTNVIAAVTNGNPFTPLVTNYLNVQRLTASGGGVYNPCTFLFASDSNSWDAWQGPDIPNPMVNNASDPTYGYSNFTCLNGAFDCFFRVNSAFNGNQDASPIRPIDQFSFSDGVAGLQVLLTGVNGGRFNCSFQANYYSDTNAQLAVVNYTPGPFANSDDASYVILGQIGAIADGEIIHLAVTMSTDTNGLITAQAFVNIGAGPIFTVSDALASATFSLNAATIGVAFTNAPYLYGVGWGGGGPFNVDYSTVRLWSNAPSIFPGLLGTVELSAGSTVAMTNSDVPYTTCSFTYQETGVYNWTNDQEPSSEYYYVDDGFVLLLPNAQNQNLTFEGASLTISNGGQLMQNGWNNNMDTINNLTLDNATLGMFQNGTTTLAGSITLGPGGAYYDINDNSSGKTWNITAPISGSGALTIENSWNGAPTTGQPSLLASNSYSGGTFIGTGSLLQVNADGGLGSGNVTLTDTNAALSLQGGTVNNYIAPTGTLILPAGLAAGSVSLNYSGTDTIAGLSYDGGNTFQPVGTYGAVGSGATYTSPDFSGSGLLDVVTSLKFLAPVVTNGQITLSWTGSGQLEWSTNLLGPWMTNTSENASPYSEAVVSGQSRFYRLVTP